MHGDRASADPLVRATAATTIPDLATIAALDAALATYGIWDCVEQGGGCCAMPQRDRPILTPCAGVLPSQGDRAIWVGPGERGGRIPARAALKRAIMPTAVRRSRCLGGAGPPRNPLDRALRTMAHGLAQAGQALAQQLGT